jgi:hypothetical protein
VYKKRIKHVLEPFLHEANGRGNMANKKVYVHVVGLGLGVWELIDDQRRLFVETCIDVIKNNHLSHIADVDFSWIKENRDPAIFGGVSEGQMVKTADINEVKIHFSRRDPAERLVGIDKGKLLVACYAWDGNAYPGNEYWDGSKSASGDPAAACCSTIAELQNPEINTEYATGQTTMREYPLDQ